MIFVKVSDPVSLAEGKERLKEFLFRASVPENAAFASKLVFSELVGNILKHSTAFAEVEGRLEQEFVELVFRASDRYLPPETSVCSDVLEESGRGLFLVDKVCFSRTVTKDGEIRVLIKIEE